MRQVVSKFIGPDNSQYIGRPNEITLVDGELRWHDGATPGGHPITGSGDGGFSGEVETLYGPTTSEEIAYDPHGEDGMESLGSSFSSSFTRLTLPFEVTWQGVKYQHIYIHGRHFVTFVPGEDPWSDTLLVELVRAPGIWNMAHMGAYVEDVYYLHQDNKFVVRIVGEDDNGDNLIWELVFYSDLPNVVDVHVVENYAIEEEWNIINGVSDSREMILIADPIPAGSARRYVSISEGKNSVSTGSVDFTSYMFRNQNFNWTELVGYWDFNDSTPNFIKDLGPLQLHGKFQIDSWEPSDGYTSSQGISLRQPSAINDGKTGITLHNGYIIIPHHERLWGFKGLEFTYGFSLVFNHGDDYFQFNIDHYDEGEVYHEHLEIEMWNDYFYVELLNGSNQDRILDLDIDLDDLRFGDGDRVYITISSNGDMFRVMINDMLFERHFDTANDVSWPDVPETWLGSYGLRIRGGVDSPTISHLFILDWGIDAEEMNKIFRVSGIGNSFGMTESYLKPLGRPTGNMNLIWDNFNLYNHFKLDELIGYSYIDERQSDSFLKPQSSTYEISDSPVDDGNKAPLLYEGNHLRNNGFDTTHFQDNDFSMGVAFQITWGTESSYLNYIIDHSGIEGAYYKRADLSINQGVVSARVYDAEGTTFAESIIPVEFSNGSNIFAALSWSSGDNELTVYANGLHVTTEGSETGEVMDFDDMSQDVIFSNQSLTIDANGSTAHVWYRNDETSIEGLETLFNATNIPRAYVTSNVNTTLVVDTEVITITNGIITDISPV